MNILDGVLILLIFLFAIWGYRKGFLQAVGGLIGLVFATIIAGRFYLWLGNLFGGSNFSNIIAFILIFVLVMKVIALFFWAIGKVFQIIAIIPFLQTSEKILGAVLGFIEGILILSVLLFFLSKYPIVDWLTIQMQSSLLVQYFLMVSYVFLPLLPSAIKTLKSFI